MVKALAKTFKIILEIIIVLLLVYVLWNDAVFGFFKKAQVYNHFEMRNEFKNYVIADKHYDCDTTYYMILKNPVDSKTKKIKVKDYVYLHWFVGDTIK